MTQKSIIITVIVALIVGAAAFFGGMKYQQTQATSANAQFAQGTGRFGGAGRFGARAGGGMATVGKIVSADSNSITVQLQDGSSKIINYSGSTKIVKTQTGSSTDLSNGTEVAVFGTTNSDGSVTAQNIQINPMTMFRARPTGTPTQ